MVYTLNSSVNFTVSNGATVPFKTSNNEAYHSSNIIICSALFYPSSDGKATISVNITGQNTSIRVFELETKL